MWLSRRDLARAAAVLAGTSAVIGTAAACGTVTAHRETAGGEAGRADPTDLGPVPAAVSAFSARLLQRTTDPAKNSVCSPLSAAVALSMTRLGAAGATAEGMDAALGMEDPTLWHEGMNTLTQTLDARSGILSNREGFEPLEPGEEPRTGQNAVLLDLANSVWMQHDLPPATAFLDGLARWYGAPVQLTDFKADPQVAVDAVNGWTAAATRDKITEIVNTDIVTVDTRLLLVNAVYLRAAWEHPFGADLTAPAAFTLTDGSQVEVPTMHGITDQWYEDPTCCATMRPYVSWGLAMAFVQPTGAVADMLTHWADGGLAALLDGFGDAEVELAVPTWDIEWEASLVAPLQDLGMTYAFDRGLADFSGMTSDDTALFLSEVVQKAAITVDEEGTEATAVTAVIADAASAPVEPPERHELILDRPFLYVVYDIETRSPLFLGVVADPSQRANG